jgi:hypothetical protein
MNYSDETWALQHDPETKYGCLHLKKKKKKKKKFQKFEN